MVCDRVSGHVRNLLELCQIFQRKDMLLAYWIQLNELSKKKRLQERHESHVSESDHRL